MEELERKLDELVKNMPEGMVQIKDPNQIVYQLMVKVEIEKIVNAKHKDINEIKETLIELLDFYENTHLAKDEIFIMIEILNELDGKEADKFILMYEKVYKKINIV